MNPLRKGLIVALAALSILLPLSLSTAEPAAANHACYSWVFDQTNWGWNQPANSQFDYCRSYTFAVPITLGATLSYAVHLSASCVAVEYIEVDPYGNWQVLRHLQGPGTYDNAQTPINEWHYDWVKIINNC